MNPSTADTGPDPERFDAFDQLASMVALVHADGHVLRVNGALENTLAASRRSLQRSSLLDWLSDPAPMRDTLAAVATNHVATSRFDTHLKRAGTADLPVHAIVTQSDLPGCVLVELIEIEQQTRLDREERANTLAQSSKDLVRNLAHEIKNPLGGIRGAAQLLQMEVNSKELTEYTQVIIHEADRLQSLVDRLLAPHRRPHVVADVNIHEVCERVRALILAEHPRGLTVVRDYDASIPEFRGDREQLIQAVLNIAHNARRRWRSASPPAARNCGCARGWRARSRSAASASDWHWNCISRTTAPACPRTSASASSTPWSAGAKAAADSG